LQFTQNSVVELRLNNRRASVKTTLNKIYSTNEISPKVFRKLMENLGKTKADDEPLSIAAIVEANGLYDALCCLCAVDGYDKEIRLYAVWCARQIQHLMSDPRSLAALDVAEAFAHGNATDAELAATHEPAWDAVKDAFGPKAKNAALTAVWLASVDEVGDKAATTALCAARVTEVGEARDAALSAQEKELLRICEEIEKGEQK
jgi:hypothetical protein